MANFDKSFSPELLRKIEKCTSKEEILALAKENGVTITEEDAEKAIKTLNKELTDEELDAVNGGICWDYTDPDCPQETYWDEP